MFSSLGLLKSTRPLKALEVSRVNRLRLYVHSIHTLSSALGRWGLGRASQLVGYCNMYAATKLPA